jgi:hypothetical protein
MQVTKFEANQVDENIILSMEVTDGDNVWPGDKSVPVGSDLKVEGDILAAEIVDANTPKPPVAEVVPVPVDVSKIVVEVKTLDEANAAKEDIESSAIVDDGVK